MARLPTKYDLSSPGSLRSGRVIATVDTSGFGRGIAALGQGLSSLGADITQSQNAVDIARAEAYKTENFLNLQNEFDTDPDYSTFRTRAPQKTNEVVKNAANIIRDPRMRERWVAAAAGDAARVNDSIYDRGTKLARQAETNAFDNALETNRRLYVDPETDDAVKAKARGDIEGAIQAGLASGLLTPDEAEARRKQYLEDADFNRGVLAAERDPSVISMPFLPKVAERSSMAMRFFQERGWTKEQAAGIVGNLLAESSLNISARNPGDGADGSDSIGIAQWNGKRVTALKKFAAENKADWRDFGVQLAFVDHELNTSEKKAGEALRSARDVQGATEAMIMYERPAGSDKGAQNAHNYRGRLKFAKQAAGEKINPEWYDRLSPENKARVVQVAENTREKIAVGERQAAKDAYDSIKGAYEADILLGNVANENQIWNDPVLENHDKAVLVKSFRSENQDRQAAFGLLEAASVGQVSINPFDGDQTKIAEKAHEYLTKNMPEDVVGQARSDLIRSTGYIPKDTVAGLRRTATLRDPQQLAEGLAQASVIQNLAPEHFSSFEGGGDLRDKLTAFHHLVDNRGLSNEEAAQHILEMADPEKRRMREALLETKTVKDTLKNVSPSDVADVFDTGIFDIQPQLGATPEAEAAITAEYREILSESIVEAAGDMDLAKTLADERISKRYGVSELSLTGSEVVTKYPPEKLYPPDSQGSHEWIRTQLKDDLSSEGVKVGEGGVFLHARPDTSPKKPVYDVYYYDTGNNLQKVPGEFVADPSKREIDVDRMVEQRRSEFDANKSREEKRRDVILRQNRGVSPLDRGAIDVEGYEADIQSLNEETPSEAEKPQTVDVFRDASP